MKVVGEKTIGDNPDTVRIIPEDADDLWVLCNHMAPGDVVFRDPPGKTSTGGNVHSKGAGRASPPPVEVRIISVDLASDSSSARVRGRVAFGALGGSLHNIDVAPGKELRFRKRRWDTASVEALREACTRRAGADSAAVIHLSPSAARVYLVGPRVTTLCDTVENAGSGRFFEGVLRALVRRVDFNAVRCAVIAGEGPMKDELRQFVLTEAQRKKMKAVGDNKARIVAVEAGGLTEALSDRRVMAMMKDTKTARDIGALNRLREMMRVDSKRVCYGGEDVHRASESDAIETLLVTDTLYGSSDVDKRRRYVELVESVKKRGGNAMVFSSLNHSGDQLAHLTGVAAILRFPLYGDY